MGNAGKPLTFITSPSELRRVCSHSGPVVSCKKGFEGQCSPTRVVSADTLVDFSKDELPLDIRDTPKVRIGVPSFVESVVPEEVSSRLVPDLLCFSSVCRKITIAQESNDWFGLDGVDLDDLHLTRFALLYARAFQVLDRDRQNQLTFCFTG